MGLGLAEVEKMRPQIKIEVFFLFSRRIDSFQ